MMAEPGAPEVEELLRRAAEARRDGRPEESRPNLERALAVAREGGARRTMIAVLKALGRIDRDVGRPADALARYEEAMVLCREEGDARLTAHTVRHVGDLQRLAGRSDDAELCYLEALALYRAAKETHPLELANALRPMAILREAAGRRTEARELWARARALYAEVGVQAGVDECDERLARLESGGSEPAGPTT